MGARRLMLLVALWAGLVAVAAAQGPLPEGAPEMPDDPFAYPEMIIRAQGKA